MRRLFVFGCLAVGALASGCAAAATARSAGGSGSAAVSSRLVGPEVSFVPTSPSSAWGSTLVSPAPTANSPLLCSALGLHIDALPVGTHVEHIGQDALRVAAAARVGPTLQLRVYVAWVQDPIAGKVGLGDSAQFRVMWILDGTDTIATPKPGEPNGPAPNVGAMRPGAVYRTLTVIDDQTMKLGGNFACTSTTAANPPDSELPSVPNPSSSPSPICSGFALSLASDRGGQSSPVKAAVWFARHGAVPGIPDAGWKEVSTGKAEATVQSGGVQLHVLEGPDQTWQVDSGQYCCP
jgi:hypothetical protein